ncbi:MAG: hypothetical protein JKY37_08795, partial [Nannocystaceae bacterium]|nr:hypothetical protein [Nannocystaceae bacterium]
AHEGDDPDQPEQTPSETPEQSEPPELGQSLLHTAVEHDDKRGRWAYPLWGKLLASVVVLAHASILLVWAMPSKGLAKGTHTFFNKHFQMNKYLRATGTRQSWAMFAPNPNRTNIFVRVFVEDNDGEVWDMQHDIYGRRTYPYLWYDRRGKINRRLARTAGYRRHYAAWVCRQWEKEHGELPKEVRFAKLSTRIPTPKKVWRKTKGRPWLGYNPMKLKLTQKDEGKFTCKTTPHAQLPDYLRERYGMEPAEKDHFRKVRIRTWVDVQKQKERKEERDAERLERDAARKAKADLANAPPTF